MINLDSTIFNISQQSIPPAAGRLLVSEPFLREVYFNHSVIMLLDHDESSSMGLVMNNRMDYRLGQILDEVDESLDIPVYCGGPVGNDRLFYMHSLGDIFDDSERVAPGLWIGGDFSQVLEYIADGNPVEGVLRFFLGYSGWERGQLAGELDEHVWAVTRIPVGLNLLRGSDDSYWHKVVRTLGRRYHGWRYHPAQLIAN